MDINIVDLTNKNKLVMCGCAESGWYVVRYLLKIGVKFSYFVTIDEITAKKNNVSGYKSFSDLAEIYGVPIYYVKTYTLKSEEDLNFFQEHSFDLLIQGGWQRLFPDAVLKTLRVGAVGCHGSSDFLPQGRGRSPINWSLIEGKQRFIMHYFLIKPGIDDGDVFHYEIFDINQWDTCRTLYYKNSMLTMKTLNAWIPRLLSGSFQALPQKGNPTYYPKRTPEDGLIDWSKSVFEIYDFIRAITEPYPGAFTFINSTKVTIWKAQPFDSRLTFWDAQVGEILEIFDNGDFVVSCNSGLLLITEYQIEPPLLLEIGLCFHNGA